MPAKAKILALSIMYAFCLSTAAETLAQQPSITGHHQTPSSETQMDMPPVKKIGQGIFRLGTIQINKRTGSITFPARVNMDHGLVEYLLVKSTGKTHESVLRTEVDPYYLNLAFLLLGFEGTTSPLAQQGASDIPTGDPVKIDLIYHNKKGSVRSSAKAWLMKKKNGTDGIPEMKWLYTGSVVQQGKFMAQLQGSIIAVFHDPAALIDNTDPDGNNDEIWFVNQDNVPPEGTDVIVKISAIR